jgi:uncharacterized membrane protein
MGKPPFSFSEAFSIGWSQLKKRWVFIVAAFTTLFAIEAVFGYLIDVPYRDIEPTSSLLAILALLIRMWLNFNLLVIMIRLFDDVEPKWGDLFLWREETLSYVSASILYCLLVFVGCIFFVIPGLYFALKYSFYGYLIADKKLGAIEALKASARLTVDMKWLLVGFGVVTASVLFLGLLAFGIGLLIAIPVVSLAVIFVYRSLYRQTFDTATAPSSATAAV